jgi:hypothetical protein
MLAAAAVLSGSVAAVVAAVVAALLVLLRVAEGRAHLAHKLLALVVLLVVAVLAQVRPELVLLQVAVVLAQVHLERLLLHPLPLPLPQVVVESEATLHRQGRQSFSAAMARSSPPTVQPTYERAPSTRSPPKGRTCPSACQNWTRVRG